MQRIIHNGKEFVTAADAGERFGRTRDYIAKLARDGLIVGEKIDGIWFVEETSVGRFLESIQEKEARRLAELKQARVSEYYSVQENNPHHAIILKPLLLVSAFAFVVLCTASAAHDPYIARALLSPGDALVAHVDRHIKPIELGAYFHYQANEVKEDLLSILSEYKEKNFTRHALFSNGEIELPTFGIWRLIPTNLYDRFTTELASLWVERDAIRRELTPDISLAPVVPLFHETATKQVADAARAFSDFHTEARTNIFAFLASVKIPLNSVGGVATALKTTTTQSASVLSALGDATQAFFDTLFGVEEKHDDEKMLSTVTSTSSPVTTERVVERVTERVVEPRTYVENIVRHVTFSGVSSDELAQKLAELEQRLIARIPSSSGAPSVTYVTSQPFSHSQKIDQLSGVAISGGTISGATITGGSVDVGALSGSIGIAQGGTGTTTAPSQDQLLIGNGTGYDLKTLTAGSNITIATSSNAITISSTGGGGSSFGQAFELATNVFSQSALAPTTTQNLAISGTGTSTFAGGVEAWRQIASPYFHATSSTATSTFAGGLSISGGFNLFGTYGNSWDDFCAAITGGSGLCDGTDSTGSGGNGLSTSTDIADTYVIFGTSVSDVGGEVAFTYDDATDKLTVVNASTTRVSASYASSTQGFFGSLSIGNLTGFLKATAGVVATALIDLASDVSGILAVVNGGTGWANIQANTLLLGNGTSRLATTSAGTNGQTLTLVGGVPTWVSTTTFSSGLTYSGGNVTADLGTSISDVEVDDNITISSGGSVDWTALTNYATGCTNQFVRTIGDTLTCATVGAADVSLANLSATDATLTFSGTYNGSTARTIGLNLSNANTWTALQTFSANASSTAFTITNTATSSWNYGNTEIFGSLGVGRTATTTIRGDSATSTFASGISGTGLSISSHTNLGGNLTFNGVTGSTWAAFCSTITGGSGLCDGTDDTAAGASSAYEIATTSDIAVSQLAYFTQTGGRTTLGGVATGTISSANSALSVTANRSVLGGSLTLTIATTSNNIFTGTTGQVLAYTANGWTGVATTTFSTGLTYAGGNVTCDTANGSTFGCLSAADWTTFNSKLAGSYDPFPRQTTYGVSAAATSSSLWIQGGLYASSTVALGTAGNDLYFNASNGRLGIGTSTPWAKLSVDAPAGVNSFAIGSSTETYFLVNSSGNVGIGTSSPSSFLSVNGAGYFTGYLGIGTNNSDPVGANISGAAILSSGVGRFSASGASALSVNRTSDGTVMSINSGGSLEGTISVSGATVSYNAFTGSHYALVEGAPERGQLIALTGTTTLSHVDQPGSEPIYSAKVSTQANNPQILGSYLALLNPSDPRSLNNPELVMAVGNGDMWVAQGKEESIELGDYLISSVVPGHATKDPETYLVAHVVAKAAEAVDWSMVASTTADGVKHKKISVTFEQFDKVMPFDDAVTRLFATSTEGTGESSSFASSFFLNLFARISEWLASAANGIGDFFANRVHTKELCVSDAGGAETCIIKAQLDTLLAGAAASGSAGSGGAEGGEGATASSSAPVITIQGNNPAYIEVGATYADLGALVSDDEDNNLGIHTFVDGEEVSTVTLDTSISTTYTIIYRVTDTDGNVGEATRTVIVYSETQDDSVAPEEGGAEEAEAPADDGAPTEPESEETDGEDVPTPQEP